MTNSIIPYSFIPGTKAKATEVNANFASLANFLEQYKTISDSALENLSQETEEKLNLKADKTDLITEHTISEENTDLDDYKTKGTYIFTSDFTPENIPQGTSGMLIVTGDENSVIKQIWLDTDSANEIFTRNFKNSEWSDWKSTTGNVSLDNLGYLTFPNGLIIQWGLACGSSVTYPIAFETLACPVFMKHGCGLNFERSDTGFAAQSLTGFNMLTGGFISNINWIAIGY